MPLGSTTETRTLDGSFATLSSVPSIGTGCIVTAVVDMAGSRVELTDCPSSRPATAFPARPGTRCPTGELALRGDRKKFQNVQVELRDYDSALRSARGKADPGGSGVQPLRCRSAAPARSASAKDAEHDCWRGHSRAPAHLLLLHAGSHAALGRAGAVAKAGGVPMGVSSPTGKKRRKQFAVGKNRDLQTERYGFMRFHARRRPLGGTDGPLHGCRRSRGRTVTVYTRHVAQARSPSSMS